MPAARGSRDEGESVGGKSPLRRARRRSEDGEERHLSRRKDRSSSASSYDSSRHGSRRTRAELPTGASRRSRSRSYERRPKQERHRSRDREHRRSRNSASRSPVGRTANNLPRERHVSREANRETQRHVKDRDSYRDRPKDKHRDRSRERRDRSNDSHRDRSRERRRRRDGSKDTGHRKDRRTSRSASPRPHHSTHKRQSRSPDTSRALKRRRHSPSRSPSPHHRSRKPLPSQEISFRGLDNSDQPPTKYGGAPPDREKPNFAPTGLLAKAANLVTGTKISLKYHEPPEARKPPPSAQWRLFIFKGPDMLETIELHTRSCWLLGRAHEVADIVLAHPSSSSQHAVIQFRYIVRTVEDEYGVQQQKGKVKPYLIDLDSSNGTELNGEPVEKSRYVELRDKDVLQFGASEREYVIMLPPKDG